MATLTEAQVIRDASAMPSTSRRRKNNATFVGVGACAAPCMAETLRILKNPYLPGCESEQWTPCGGLQSSGDVLCPTHRRMVNRTAKLSGQFDHKTLVRVHSTAFRHPSCRFPATFFMDEEISTRAASEFKKSYDDWYVNNPAAAKDMVPLDQRNHIVDTMGSFFGTS